MKPPAFEYRAPETLEEALALLAERPEDAKPLAGGQSLVPAMNFRLAVPALLVDLNRVAELDWIREADGGVSFGAMTRQRAVERSELVAERAPLLSETLPHVAHPQIRNRGTIGGSVAHADPAAEMPAAMLALGARFRAARAGTPEGRWIEAAEFFTGLFGTALEPGELLVEMEVPAAPARTGWAFREFARRHGDYALVGVAAGVTLDEAGRCARTRIALLSVGDGPVAARAAEAAMEGEAPTNEVVRAAAEAAAAEIDPSSDIHAPAEYRRHLTRVLVDRALTAAAGRAGEEP
ncbi:MAG TPA: xanthine dehydrogenase family protein subunit M [Gemmatimonadota bacterium]|nr:xanthine dehydrogenase family protein subunit M [Gemmatimonadota bacterium]